MLYHLGGVEGGTARCSRIASYDSLRTSVDRLSNVRRYCTYHVFACRDVYEVEGELLSHSHGEVESRSPSRVCRRAATAG